MAEEFRIEKDTLGEVKVPAGVYYGPQTARAVENFPISGLRAFPALIEAVVIIKRSAAKVNMGLGLLERRVSDAIVKTADEVLAGSLRDQFVIDVFQAGAGTSFNMNANEVIANRAIELLGGRRGEYKLVHPNDHVNMAQSTNDVFPTAMRISALVTLGRLVKVLEPLCESFSRKAAEFAPVVKSGRTHLQDAAPLTLGQEFSGFAHALHKDLKRIEDASHFLEELGIGGTAVGTGLNAHPDYREQVVKEIAQYTGIAFRAGENLFELMQSMADFVHLSGALRALAVDLIKIANDLRLLSSGPTTGLDEIVLPPVQPGSSIMPGKVNPVMAEALNMVAFQVIGNDHVVSMAAQAGQLELNVMMPVIIWNLLFSMEILKGVLAVFRTRCVEGITANVEKCMKYAESSLGLATALNPYIGYEKAAQVVKEAFATGKSIRQVAEERGIVSAEIIEKIFKQQ